jgi:hypothetical protein
MCSCTSACMRASMAIRLHVSMLTFECISACTCASMCMCVCVHTHVQLQLCRCACCACAYRCATVCVCLCRPLPVVGVRCELHTGRLLSGRAASCTPVAHRRGALRAAHQLPVVGVLGELNTGCLLLLSLPLTFRLRRRSVMTVTTRNTCQIQLGL